MDNLNLFKTAFMNIKGQSGLTLHKQLQIEKFIIRYNLDALHLQEINIDSDAFSNCDFISANYNIYSNNNITGYGTATLLRTEFSPENIKNDNSGRVQIIDIGCITISNIYFHSGTDNKSRSDREQLCSEVLPNLLINSKDHGYIGGDYNCIINKMDATHHPEQKMSRSLERLRNNRSWSDSFRELHPSTPAYSRFYEYRQNSGASRIDRCYNFGGMKPMSAQYIPVAFSDHFAHVVTFNTPDMLSKIMSPKPRPRFKLRAEIIKDPIFKERVKENMITWKRVREFQADTNIGSLKWWELLVKPGIKRIALERNKEINKEKGEKLNLLNLRQAYLTRKLQNGELHRLAELNQVHHEINEYFRKECEKIQQQARAYEFQSNEKTTIYHHELHKRKIKKCSILKLQTTDGIIEGHSDCARLLEKTVEDLLLHPATLDPVAQETLLNEVNPVFTDEDNQMFLSPPTKNDIWETICESNLQAAPGSDGIPSLFYKECWKIMDDSLHAVMNDIFEEKKLPPSLRTSLMVFGAKPKKPGSILPKDKRRISLLNSDFKIATGLEARKMKKTATHSLSHLQLVAGDDRRIHHGINLARNAIYAASKPGHKGCGILDTDLIAAFDYLCLEWAYMVLERKGLHRNAINRLRNLYSDNISVIVVNNIEGKAVKNIRLSLRQGDLPSMHLFAFGIDPLLTYLEKRLQGILIASLPVEGPVLPNTPQLPPQEERYKVIGYADDVKPAVTKIEEFILIDNAMALFERASGCKLHRDPESKKCKFLPLAKWKGTLKQEDIPCPYMTLTDELEMVGVELKATWTQTRKANGDAIQKRVSSKINLWKGGKFMPLSMRSWSINTYGLSKVWFKTHSVDLRVLDITNINKSVKSWLYADMLFKPEEMIMVRPAQYGGLGVHDIKHKALAGLIRSFLETACNTDFRHSLFHEILYRYHVMDDKSMENPGIPPFYSASFFETIKKVYTRSPSKIAKMTEAQWYHFLLEENVIKEENEEQRLNFIPCRAELMNMENDWETSWRRMRLKGLGSELVSFLFKLLHQLLVTQERLSRINQGTTSTCKAAGCPGDRIEDIEHALMKCPGNNDIGRVCMDAVKIHIPDLTIENALLLNFEIEKSMEFPIVWFLAVTWKNIWDARCVGKQPELYKIRSDMEARIALLRTTRSYENDAIMMEILMESFK